MTQRYARAAVVLLAVWNLHSVQRSFAATIIDEGVWRIQTSNAVTNFYNGACNTPPGVCTQMTNSTAATSDAWIGKAIELQQVYDGDYTEWRFFKPDGTMTTASERWDAASCCWIDKFQGTYCLPTCSPSSTPTLAEWIWAVTSFHCGQPGSGYRIELWNNGVQVLPSDAFSLQHDASGLLGITLPEDDRISYSPFNLVQINQSNSTSALARFSAGTNGGNAINWSVTTHYFTLGWSGSDPPTPRQFTTTNGVEHDETYQSLGGQVQVQASTTAVGTTITDCVTTYIEGPESGILDATITARLDSLYPASANHGPTTNLLTGATWIESGYHQFLSFPVLNQENLFGTSAFGLNPKFPTESPTGAYPIGHFIGLMQVPTTNADAWDWTINTQDGVNVFSGSSSSSKMALAKKYWSDSINGKASQNVLGHKNMADLTGSQHEDNALMLYGGFVADTAESAILSSQTTYGELYWVPNCTGTVGKQGNQLTCSTGWQVMPNPRQVNITMDGIAYVGNVRANGK